MRVLICGSRSWGASFREFEVMEKRIISLPSDAIIIHGDARGADRMGAGIGRARNFKVESFPANWDQYGKKAGILRNLEMLDSGIDLVLAFYDGTSAGTRHTILEARKRGIPMEVHLREN